MPFFEQKIDTSFFIYSRALYKASMEVNERCLVPMQFATYKDKIWCDVLTIDAGHVILSRPWLFDMDATLWGKSNTCTFNYEGQRIKLIPSQPRSKQEKKPVDTRKEKNLNLINPKEIEQEVISGAQVIVLVAREVAKESHEMFS